MPSSDCIRNGFCKIMSAPNVLARPRNSVAPARPPPDTARILVAGACALISRIITLLPLASTIGWRSSVSSCAPIALFNSSAEGDQAFDRSSERMPLNSATRTGL